MVKCTDAGDNIPDDLVHAIELCYNKHGLDITEIKIEGESKEYGACRFMIQGKHILFRISKITPTKTGQFVTIWKRNSKGITQPFDATDAIDFVIISSREGKHLGQFIFPRSILLTKGIMANGNKPGKRGIRVYPPWSVVTNRQAGSTQSWQMEYFVNIEPQNEFKQSRVEVLFG